MTMEKDFSIATKFNTFGIFSSRKMFRLCSYCTLFVFALLSIDTFGQEEVVHPASDGSLHLSAENGKGIGPEIKYMPEWEAFGWFTADDRVEWSVEVGKEGKYDVILEWSVSDEEAGKPFLIVAGDQQLGKKVKKTGSWETFKSEKIGRLRLSAGQQKIVFKPNSEFEEGALLDLRAIKLVPVK